MPIFRDIHGTEWSLYMSLEQVGPSVPPPDPVPPPMGADRLRVSGTTLLLPDGGPWVGRGVNLMDTRGCNACTTQAPNAAEVIRRMEYFVAMGATFFRLCLESYPEGPNTFDAPGRLDDVELIVAAAGDMDVQILVSLWIDDTLGPVDWLPTTRTYSRLAELGRRLEKYPHAWIGCCNEPTQNWNGEASPARFAIMQDCVTAIRSAGFTGLVTVQGLAAWGRYMEYYYNHRIADSQVVYETHIYGPPTDYDRQVAQPLAQALPILIGEYGKVDNYMTQDAALAVGQQAKADGVTAAAWVGHHRCGPDSALLVDHSAGGCGIGMLLELTPWGTALVAMWGSDG